MVYDYTNPYMSSYQNSYNGIGSYQPMSNINSQSQQALNPYYQMNNGNRFNAFFVNDYSEVKNATVSSDGKPSLFIMNDKDVFYIKKVGEDGRTILKSFEFQEFIDKNDVVDNDKNFNLKENEEFLQMQKDVNGLKQSLNQVIELLSSQVKGGNNNDKEHFAQDF